MPGKTRNKHYCFQSLEKECFLFQPFGKQVQFPAIGNRFVEVRQVKMHGSKKNKRGQVMLEYVVALGVFLALIGVSAALIYVFRAYGNRVLDIIAVS